MDFKRSGIRSSQKQALAKTQTPMAIEAVKAAIDQLAYPIRDVDLVKAATYTPMIQWERLPMPCNIF